MGNIRQNLNNPFAALKHKNFRIYWFGMCISLIGTWMQNIAQPWLAYTLTSSAFLLSLVSALQFTPMLLFSLFAGAWIDKFPKKNILLFTQSASLVITLAFAILNSMGIIRYWHILVLATLMGIVNTLDMPTRQSFVIELVGKNDLMNAIALNSSVFNLARIIGPALAGIVMGIWGLTVCFYANAISFGAVIISLLLINPEHVQALHEPKGNIFRQIGDGLKYVAKTPILLETILTTAIVGAFAFNTSVLVPVFAKEILGQKETGFGLLMSLMGIGSFLGAMTMALMSKAGPKKTILNLLPLVISGFLILTGFTGLYALTGLSLAALGFSLVWFSSTANSMVQIFTANEYRGRVMSIYTLAFSGFVPFGNLYAGAVTNWFGPRIGFAACGLIILLLYSTLLWVRKMKG